MKKLLLVVCLLLVGLVNAQEVKPKFEVSGDLVKATYFFDNGEVKEQGFFKDKKLTGTWVSFNESGNKSVEGKYRNGKKVGTWTFYTIKGVKEVSYMNNTVASVKTFYTNTSLASN